MTISPPPHDRTYRLTIPAAAEFVATARLFVFGVASTADVDDEIADDLKLAVSELVSGIVAHGRTAEVTVSAFIDDSRLTIEVTPWPSDISQHDFGPFEIVDALFPGASSQDAVVSIPVDLGRDD